VNEDGTLSLLTATNFLLAIGASDGMANPMEDEGALVVGGTDGLPTALPPGADGHSLQMVDGLPAWGEPPASGIEEAPEDGKHYARKDGDWEEVVSGGGLSTAAKQTFTSADQVSNNIVVELDLTTNNFFPLDFNGSPLPSTSGSYTINLNNVPDATTHAVTGHISAGRLGRKSTVTIASTGKTISWLGTPSFQSGASGVDLINYYISPLQPTVIRLSQIDSRSS
jgi:hypothetical protein